jgi:hypothetical protein
MLTAAFLALRVSQCRATNHDICENCAVSKKLR